MKVKVIIPKEQKQIIVDALNHYLVSRKSIKLDDEDNDYVGFDLHSLIGIMDGDYDVSVELTEDQKSSFGHKYGVDFPEYVYDEVETKYSKEQFDGFTHRFMIQFEVGEPHISTLTLYSNSDSYEKLEKFINEKKNKKVIMFKIVHRASKEQDELASSLIDETLAGI